MRTEYFITMDAHCRTTDLCVKTRLGKLVRQTQLKTTIPQLAQFIEAVPRPRHLSFEESAIAGWLYRNLRLRVDQIVVCDPRRNAYVAKDGDKDDPIDAQKLNDLYRGGLLRPVHQLDTAQKAANKQVIAMYHTCVGQRVGQANSLLALGKRWGLLLRSVDLIAPDAQNTLPRLFSDAGAPAEVLGLVQDLYQGWTHLLSQESRLHEQVCGIVRQDKVMRRVAEVPGYGPIRSATLICYLDTPWRFPSKAALWKYVGIGLTRQHSGNAPPIIKVEQACNHLLRNVTIGAAQSVIQQKESVFARRYHRWIASGLCPRNARRNVARDLVTAIWGMWKTDTAFDPGLLNDPEAE